LHEDWCFALINDPHIGCFYADYAGSGFDDRPTAQEYFLTQRMRRTVDWLNSAKDDPAFNIKFVVVNGDITQSAEESEFLKAKEILDGLRVPYVPLLGNHDVWPYTDSENASEPSGSYRFDAVFGGAFEALAASSVTTGWSKDAGTVLDTPLENYSFDVEGLHFLALDCCCRKPPIFGPGVDGKGVFHPGTKEWLLSHLEKWGDEPVVLLCHHPLTNKMIRPAGVGKIEWELVKSLLVNAMPSDGDCGEIEKCLVGRSNVRALFAGHVHSCELLVGHMPTPPFIWDFNALGFEKIAAADVRLTEALVAGSNGPDCEDKGTIRIVRVGAGNVLDCTTVLGDRSPAETCAFNPSFDVDCVDGMYLFTPHRFTKQTVEFRFDFGDGTTSGDFEAFEEGWEDRVNLADAVSCQYADGLESHDVTLTVRRETAPGRYFDESITRTVRGDE
jgi:3',5'-cyclic AMP phosphodiesterase CpdA